MPWLPGGIRPFLFVALAASEGLRRDALAGGTWGFAGGLALGLLYADGRLGALALGGLLAGSLPAALKRPLYWQRAGGQALLGALAGAVYALAPLLLSGGGAPAAPLAASLPRVAADAMLTGAVCPLVFRLTGRRGVR